MGWTVDFGDVKELFDPIFKRIDHHPLTSSPASTSPMPQASRVGFATKQLEASLSSTASISRDARLRCDPLLGRTGPRAPNLTP